MMMTMMMMMPTIFVALHLVQIYKNKQKLKSIIFKENLENNLHCVARNISANKTEQRP